MTDLQLLLCCSPARGARGAEAAVAGARRAGRDGVSRDRGAPAPRLLAQERRGAQDGLGEVHNHR